MDGPPPIRNDNDFSLRYRAIVKALARLRDETVIDEVVALDEQLDLAAGFERDRSVPVRLQLSQFNESSGNFSVRTSSIGSMNFALAFTRISSF